MGNAKALLFEFLSVVPDGKKAASLFTYDGVVELPFLHSIGIATRYQGHAAIAGFYDLIKQLYPDMAFKPHDTHVLIETPDQVFAEYTAHTTAAATGRRIHHMFAARLVVEGDEIKLLRESLNVLAAAQALNPNGLNDIPFPTSEIHSVEPNYQS